MDKKQREELEELIKEFRPAVRLLEMNDFAAGVATGYVCLRSGMKKDETEKAVSEILGNPPRSVVLVCLLAALDYNQGVEDGEACCCHEHALENANEGLARRAARLEAEAAGVEQDGIVVKGGDA